MKIKEGSVVIDIPKAKNIYEADVFYNPEMEFDRNISVSVAANLEEIFWKELDACDLLSASGVRGMRYAKEAKVDVHLNDYSKDAVKMIKKNMKANKVKAKITQMDGNLLMRSERFGFIDIDPFGSPISFIDSAASSLPSKGFLAFTATDTAPLSGSYPQTCLRRYGIRSMKTDYYHELGLRILITAVMRKFLQEDKAFSPLLTYARVHYFRCFGKVESGAVRCNQLLEKFSPVSHCFKCGWRDLSLKQECPLCKSKTQFVENVYIGEINNKQFCSSIEKDMTRRKFKKSVFVERLSVELQVPFYYDTHYLAGRLKISAPRIEELMEKLMDDGFKVSRTHFCDTAIKTDCGFEKFIELMKSS